MAEEFLSPIDMLLDENNTDNIKLYNEDNQEVEFEQIALVPIEEKTYAILKPVANMEGIAEDEALVFVIDEIDDEDCLVIVEDDSIVDKVFEEYYKMLKEEGIIRYGCLEVNKLIEFLKYSSGTNVLDD